MEVVQNDIDGFATDEQREMLQAHAQAWTAALLRLLDSVSASLDKASKSLHGRERYHVVADYTSQREQIDQALTALIGPSAKPLKEEQKASSEEAFVEPLVQLSWQPGRIILWASERNAQAKNLEELEQVLAELGADSIDWEPYKSLRIPGQGNIDALTAPIGAALGWLVGLLSLDADDAKLGVSARWLAVAVSLSIKVVAQGRAFPQMRKYKKRLPKQLPKGVSSFEVRWSPALLDQEHFAKLSSSVPASVAISDQSSDRRSVVTSILNDFVTSIFREAASRLELPAGVETATSAEEVSESFLASVDGSTFSASSQFAGDITRKIDKWSLPIAGTKSSQLVVQLDPPDDSDAWYLSVLAYNSDHKLMPVERVIVNSSNSKSKEVEADLLRLERLYPELLRPGARRRGEVLLSQDEAWHLMTVAGSVMVAAGYEVRAPVLSRKKPSPSLRLSSFEAAEDSVVGAQQLANVTWSVAFDDVELSAEQVRELASQAKPLVQSHGRWVELDKADLAEAAAALEERADKTNLTGADMLRHALGLEGTPFSGGISLAGSGWAADLLQSASDASNQVLATPKGFKGELRSYQAEARTWLNFLDSAGLGGCLALDMGLGKTPTMLAHIGATKGEGPALIIVPPAVVGNWASEAKTFVPDVRVKVHHGPNRAPLNKIAALAKSADVIITTYGTAIRDVSALEKIEWSKTVLDEAQAIKNPQSETAQQLRRIPSTTRIALTGTPIENGLGDLWAILDYTNPGLVGDRNSFIHQLSLDGTSKESAESALKALNGILVFRRTKAEPAIAAELPDRIDNLAHCAMTAEQIGLYQAVLDSLVIEASDSDTPKRKGAVLAAITALKQICNHPNAYQDDDGGLEGRSGKLNRLNEIIDAVFAADERILIFTHFASWGEKMADYLTKRMGVPIPCYHGGLSRGVRDKMVDHFQSLETAGAMVLSLKAGGTGLNLTAANHVVLYDRWWNPAVEDQARDRVWRIGQENTVVCHRLVCPGTVDERVEEVVAGKRRIADMVLPKSSTVGDLDAQQLQVALGIDPELLLAVEESEESKDKLVMS